MDRRLLGSSAPTSRLTFSAIFIFVVALRNSSSSRSLSAPWPIHENNFAGFTWTGTNWGAAAVPVVVARLGLVVSSAAPRPDDYAWFVGCLVKLSRNFILMIRVAGCVDQHAG